MSHFGASFWSLVFINIICKKMHNNIFALSYNSLHIFFTNNTIFEPIIVKIRLYNFITLGLILGDFAIATQGSIRKWDCLLKRWVKEQWEQFYMNIKAQNRQKLRTILVTEWIIQCDILTPSAYSVLIKILTAPKYEQRGSMK